MHQTLGSPTEKKWILIVWAVDSETCFTTEFAPITFCCFCGWWWSFNRTSVNVPITVTSLGDAFLGSVPSVSLLLSFFGLLCPARFLQHPFPS